MRLVSRSFLVAIAVVVAVFGSSVRVAEAVDGQVIINQSRAGAGGVTPGDGAGFPVTISQPGSYRLSGNLTVPNENTSAIVVTADDVTIDLNGFAILGPNVCTASGSPTVVTCSLLGSGSGIDWTGTFPDIPKNTTVINGTVRGMGAGGVRVVWGRVDRLFVESNQYGVGVSGEALITNSTARVNRYDGFTGWTAIISGSMAASNGQNGIAWVGPGAMVSGNTSINNQLDGIYLNFGDSGYANNVMTGNGGNAVLGGVNMGHNLCNGAMCP